MITKEELGLHCLEKSISGEVCCHWGTEVGFTTECRCLHVIYMCSASFIDNGLIYFNYLLISYHKGNLYGWLFSLLPG